VLAGVVAVEFGYGSGYVSAWLARRGARPVGVDIPACQLAIAQRLQGEFGVPFPLVQADAVQTSSAGQRRTHSSGNSGKSFLAVLVM
jgi:predicted O-methyltransferase YrrM